jgi:hypothetical protein
MLQWEPKREFQKRGNISLEKEMTVHSEINAILRRWQKYHRIGWCSGNALDPYSGSVRFESQTVHRLSCHRFLVTVIRKAVSYSSGGLSPASRVRTQVRSCGILWWTKWHWGRFSPSTSVSPADSRSTDCSTFIMYHPSLVQWAK